ncbi:agmatinase [Sphingomonas guangdongensis]|uniref:Agmatinase n=1 Tax=Sphingomonas guangdongensis TaxID=1141890 RepID=A0A285R596_9SPHN|nr:arginase family protein [Sphingomonas guangdongensis]SOB87522.1 agmatinase [Sphingomonas guangdongensis]
MSFPTFIRAPAARLDDLRGAHAVVVGASEATPYADQPSHAARAPAAIRDASIGFAAQLAHHDFDLDGTMPTGGIVDVGDVPTKVDTPAENRLAIEQAVALIVTAGAMPVVLGGDDSVPIPALAGFAGERQIEVLQIDAHADWGDRVRGNPLGYGSTMRRASEMAHVTGMVQVGLRGLGSGKAWQIEDARAWGSQLVTAREFRRKGAAATAARLTPGARVVISLDCDGIDPAVFPAVAMPTPGGLSYDDVIDLLHATAERATIAGIIVAEHVPDRDDARRRSAAIAARIACVAMGLALR